MKRASENFETEISMGQLERATGPVSGSLNVRWDECTTYRRPFHGLHNPVSDKCSNAGKNNRRPRRADMMLREANKIEQ